MVFSRTKYTIFNAIFGLLVRGITLITAFISRTIFIKVLGIEYVGISGLFSDILLVLSFAELGIGSAITYALYKPIAESDKEQIAKLMTLYKKVYTSIAVVVLLLGVCLIPFLKYIVHGVPDVQEDIRFIFFLYVLNSSASYLFVYKSTLLTAAQKDYLVSKYRIFITIAKTIIECVVLLLLRDFIAYLLISIAFSVLQNVIIAKVAEREFPEIKLNSKQAINTSEKKSLIANVKALFLYKISGVVLNGTDSIVTSAVLGTSWVGMLGNYYLISNQLYGVVMQLFSATSASIGNLSATSNSEHQYRVFRKMHFICFWIYCFCATCLWTMYKPFVVIWLGEQYLLTTSVTAAIIIEFYMRGMLSPISQFRTSNGLFIQGKYRPVIMAVINIVLSIILAKYVGLLGVILGTIFSRMLTQLWFDPLIIYKYVFKKSVWSFYWMYFLCICVTILSCGISTLLYNVCVTDSTILNCLIAGIIAIIVSNLLVILLFHHTDDYKEVLQLISQILKRRI